MAKKTVIPITLFLLFGSVIVVNLLPLLSFFLHFDTKDLSQYGYLVTIFSYLSVIATLLLEKDNLATFNLDRLSVLILVVVGFIRINIHVPNELLYKTVIGVLSLVLFFICLVEWKKIPPSNTRWAIIGFLVCVIAVPIAWVEMTQVDKYIVSNRLYEERFVVTVIRNLINQFSFIAPFEEITIRGILWGQLRKWNIGENKIFWQQLILYWLMHFLQLFTISFLLVLFLGIAFSLLVRYSKQTFPSIIAHALTNLLVPIFVMIFSR
jgi:membrane protease YdiL (CAAX protease family)